MGKLSLQSMITARVKHAKSEDWRPLLHIEASIESPPKKEAIKSLLFLAVILRLIIKVLRGIHIVNALICRAIDSKP